MKIKIQDRQTGKTTDILKELKKNKGALMIVPNQHFKQEMIKQHKLEGRVFTLNEVMSGAICGRNYTKIYIDEIGCCLDTMIPKLAYGTHTNEH